MEVHSNQFVSSEPSSIPDAWLELLLPQAVDLIIRNTLISIVEASQFWDQIYLGPKVFIPDDIQWDLSVGMKYLFHQSQHNKLIANAWKDFVCCFRWQVHFTLLDEQKTYSPDYDMHEPSKKTWLVLPFYIDYIIQKGQLFVHNKVCSIPDNGANDSTFKVLGPRLKVIKEFLHENDYIITATDKNLGIAVSKHSWIIKKSKDCISNLAEYKLLTNSQVQAILNEKCRIIKELFEEADIFLDWKHGQLSEYLMHIITVPGNEHYILEFYRIPKIHKQPVKFRLILPCHSAIQNLAAKLCSKHLKPIVDSAPAIIKGTKNLVIKLSKLSLQPGCKVFLENGDVVVFYPNIPLDKCLNRVYQMYMEHYWNDDPNYNKSLSRQEQEFFWKCLNVGNTKLITQFQKVKYQQLNGLAMGVAYSPDLTNLYGWYCKCHDKVLDHQNITFYGQYIDDCFGIVYASDEQEALQIMQEAVVINDCQITWEVEKFLPFLNMMLYVDLDFIMEHMPYHKALSRTERIPWIYTHPFDIK